MDPEHDFKEAFQVFDKDGDGTISFEELLSVVTDASLQGCFRQIDLEKLYAELGGIA